MMSKYQRPFQSGSRQAPDPFDQFLEQNGYFRKHTARDPSSLFRVISEQLFDTQSYHETVRKTCVEFMTRYPEYFEKDIEMNYDKYLLQLSKPRANGTIIELRALGLCYQRNIVLFEGFTTGNWFLHFTNFDKSFYVFLTEPNHFDSVFSQQFIKDVGFCQSISYNILYAKVFKLPDVAYSVERMLHDPIDYEICYQEIKSENDDYYDRICLSDGRYFELDRPFDTKCILDDYLLCGFHNQNFHNLYNSVTQHVTSIKDNQSDSSKLLKMYHSMLPKKHISCVRQIFENGITPFPYKVAKALDSDIYRNIEFDAWVEQRKEGRLRNLYTDGTDFQIGVKCLVRLRHSQQNLYNGHIQDMKPNKGDCLVFIEELGEKRSVPYANLNKLPTDQICRWTLPYNSSYLKLCTQSTQQNQSSIIYKKQRYNHYRKSSNDWYKKTKYINIPEESCIDYNHNTTICKLQPYTSLCNYQMTGNNNNQHIIAMPLLVTNNHTDDTNNNENKKSNNVVTTKTTTAAATTTTTTNSQQSITTTKISNDNNNNTNGKLNANKKDDLTKFNQKNDTVVTKNASKELKFIDDEFDMIHPPPANDYTNAFISSMPPLQTGNHTGGYLLYPRYDDMMYPAYGYEFSPSYQPMFYNGAHPAAAGAATAMTSSTIAGNYMPTTAIYHATQESATPVNMMQSIPIFSPTTPVAVASTNPSSGLTPLMNATAAPAHGIIPTTPTSPTMLGLLPIKRKDLLQSTNHINLYARPSYAMNGTDLPSDMPTTRFFYNLGHEFFKYLQSKFTMSTLHQLTVMNDHQQLSSSTITSNIKQNGAQENDINLLNNEFNNLNVVHKDRNSTTKIKHSSDNNNQSKRRYNTNIPERKTNRKETNNKRDYRYNHHNSQNNGNHSYGLQNHYHNNRTYQTTTAAAATGTRYNYYSKRDTQYHPNDNNYTNSTELAATITKTTSSDTVGSDLNNTTPRKSNSNSNQHYIGSSSGGGGGDGTEQQFISTTISGAQYYQPTGYQTFDAAFEQPSMFVPTYSGIYSSNGYGPSYGPPMTISQRSDDLSDETNDDVQQYISGHPQQMIPPAFYYPSAGPASGGHGHMPIAAAPMGYWYPPPQIGGQIIPQTSIHPTFTHLSSGSSPSVN